MLVAAKKKSREGFCGQFYKQGNQRAFPADLGTEATASGPTSVAEKSSVASLAQQKPCGAKKKIFSQPLASLEGNRAGAMEERVLLPASAAITR
ncbi:hypothetical protein L345_15475, partial [Ophiophagus hannah]